MNIPDNRDHGRSRVAHLRKVIARDVTEDQVPGRTPPELELRDLVAHMDGKYPGWDDPAPPPTFPETLKGCKKLAVRLHTQMTADGLSKRSRKAFRDQLDQLEAHISETFPE